jgi:putative transposase
MDRDKLFSVQVKGFLERQLDVKPKVTSYKSHWQNGVAERLVKSIRNELLNHVVIFSEDHLRRLMKEYIDYYNKDRCHLSLNRDSPLSRKIQQKPFKSTKVISISKLGGLQYWYERKKAA